MVVQFVSRMFPVASVGVAVTVCCPAAQAFFPPVPVGSNQVVTVPPTSPVFPLPPVPVPPVPPPPFVSPPLPPSPVTTLPPPVHTCDPVGVPEPGTMALAAVGLSAAAAAAVRKKLAKKKGD